MLSGIQGRPIQGAQQGRHGSLIRGGNGRGRLAELGALAGGGQGRRAAIGQQAAIHRYDLETEIEPGAFISGQLLLDPVPIALQGILADPDGQEINRFHR